MMIRPGTIHDMTSILQIEQAVFPSPWTDKHFLYELKENPYAFLMVAEINNIVIGYVDFWITFQQAQINNLAVHPQLQRKKIGSTLLQDALQRIKTAGCQTVTLEVRVGNRAAQTLYLRDGFKIILTKKGYYDNGEDAFLMEKVL
jgi:ribosomal-protein-alanine N-acetyltransferase